jgi:hypothetical protein
MSIAVIAGNLVVAGQVYMPPEADANRDRSALQHAARTLGAAERS